MVAIMRADGTGEHAITANDSADATDPTWSPNGKWVAYARSRKHAYPTIVVIDTSGRHRHTIARDGFYPAWSPDGPWIAYVARQGVELHLVHSNGTGDHVVLSNTRIGESRCMSLVGRLLWSADSKSLVVARPGPCGVTFWQLWRMDPYAS
jgi:Tol biopolymer transport system component